MLERYKRKQNTVLQETSSLMERNKNHRQFKEWNSIIQASESLGRRPHLGLEPWEREGSKTFPGRTASYLGGKLLFRSHWQGPHWVLGIL